MVNILVHAHFSVLLISRFCYRFLAFFTIDTLYIIIRIFADSKLDMKN